MFVDGEERVANASDSGTGAKPYIEVPDVAVLCWWSGRRGVSVTGGHRCRFSRVYAWIVVALDANWRQGEMMHMFQEVIWSSEAYGLRKGLSGHRNYFG